MDNPRLDHLRPNDLRLNDLRLNNLRLSAVADRVVAWHNRHPLARRISVAQVHAIGYVALPFTAQAPPPAASSSPSAAQAAAQAIAIAAATPLPVLADVALAAATETQNPSEGSRLRERALARARGQGADPQAANAAHAADNAAALLDTVAPAALKRNFSEPFIDTLTARQVARFALKHGRVLARAPLDGPVREVRADGGMHERGKPDRRQRVPAQVYLLTAVIETDTRKSRVLLGSGSGSSRAVLGQRIHSSPRAAALAVLGAGLVGTPLWLMQPHRAVVETLPAAVPAVVPAIVAGSAAAPTLANPIQATLATQAAAASNAGLASAGIAPSAPMPMSEVAMAVPMIEPPAAPAPEPDNPTRRRVVSIVPLLSEGQKVLAREQRQALMDAAAGAAASAAPAPARAVTQAARPAAAVPAAPVPATAVRLTPAPTPAPPVTATAPTGPVFAISTRALRTRAEADQVRVAMQALLQTLGHAGVQVDVLPQGDDWRVVALPFPQRADAEKGRALLASRGMRVAVLDF